MSDNNKKAKRIDYSRGPIHEFLGGYQKDIKNLSKQLILSQLGKTEEDMKKSKSIENIVNAETDKHMRTYFNSNGTLKEGYFGVVALNGNANTEAAGYLIASEHKDHVEYNYLYVDTNKRKKNFGYGLITGIEDIERTRNKTRPKKLNIKFHVSDKEDKLIKLFRHKSYDIRQSHKEGDVCVSKTI